MPEKKKAGALVTVLNKMNSFSYLYRLKIPGKQEPDIAYNQVSGPEPGLNLYKD